MFVNTVETNPKQKKYIAKKFSYNFTKKIIP